MDKAVRGFFSHIETMSPKERSERIQRTTTKFKQVEAEIPGVVEYAPWPYAPASAAIPNDGTETIRPRLASNDANKLQESAKLHEGAKPESPKPEQTRNAATGFNLSGAPLRPSSSKNLPSPRKLSTQRINMSISPPTNPSAQFPSPPSPTITPSLPLPLPSNPDQIPVESQFFMGGITWSDSPPKGWERPNKSLPSVGSPLGPMAPMPPFTPSTSHAMGYSPREPSQLELLGLQEDIWGAYRPSNLDKDRGQVDIQALPGLPAESPNIPPLLTKNLRTWENLPQEAKSR